MFCDQCGQQLAPSARFCNSCGKAIGMAVVPAAEGRVNRNLRVLGVLWLVYSVIRALGVVWFLLVGRVMLPFILSHIPLGPPEFPLERLISGAFFFGTALAGFLALLGLITAWGLLQHESWGRTLALVVGVVALLSIPFGTALGVYTLWVLLPAGSDEEYRRLARAA
jgi:zinc ribbon protein